MFLLMEKQKFASVLFWSFCFLNFLCEHANYKRVGDLFATVYITPLYISVCAVVLMINDEVYGKSRQGFFF